jgi:hypothetical protein
MEDNKTIFNCLTHLDFDDWINIPKPLIETLIVFKQCFIEQFRKFEDFDADFEGLNNKLNLKVKTMNETLAYTNDAIKNQQENIMKKVRERCEFLSNDFNHFKLKLIEEDAEREKIMNNNMDRLKDDVARCVKITNSNPTHGDISSLVNEKALSLHQNIVNEIRDQHLRPAVDRIMFEIKNAQE